MKLKDSLNNSKYDKWNSFDLCELIRVIIMNNFKVRNMIKSKRIYGFSDIDEWEITLVTWMLPAQTPTDPMFVNASLDLMKMVKAA